MIRVLPRDAFSDANLLKCIGKLTLLIEEQRIQNMSYTYDGKPFDIVRNKLDGSTSVSNIHFYYKNSLVEVKRPSGSMELWPLRIVVDKINHDLFDNRGNYIFKEV